MTRLFLSKHLDIIDNDDLYRAGCVLHTRGPTPLLSLFMFLALAFLVARANAAPIQLSGGLDGRAMSQDPFSGAGEEGANLHGAFINLRHVISDDRGDRYILVGQLDADHNLRELEPYQVYAQVKGPLGRINLRAGRYILPFGLLANLDTERQLVQTQEPVTLGIKLDNGVQVFGFAGPLDYALSVSQGAGRFNDPDSNKLLVARLGMQSEEQRWGLSYLDGRVVAEGDDILQQGSFDRQRLAVDAEVDWAPWLLRGELIAGEDDGHAVYGGVLLTDYDVDARLSLNTKLAWWDSDDDAREVALGLSYRLSRAAAVRVVDTYQRLNGAGEHIPALQLYWEFSHAL